MKYECLKTRSEVHSRELNRMSHFFKHRDLGAPKVMLIRPMGLVFRWLCWTEETNSLILFCFQVCSIKFPLFMERKNRSDFNVSVLFVVSLLKWGWRGSSERSFQQSFLRRNWKREILSKWFLHTNTLMLSSKRKDSDAHRSFLSEYNKISEPFGSTCKWK